MLLNLIGIAFLQLLAIQLLDTRKQKALVRFAGGTAMAAILLGQVIQFDYDAYASTLRKMMNCSEITENTQEESRRLNRLFIEKECSAYIIEKADALGVTLLEVDVTLSWNTDGYWYPSAAALTVLVPCDHRRELEVWIETDLGIPISSQTWNEEEFNEP